MKCEKVKIGGATGGGSSMGVPRKILERGLKNGWDNLGVAELEGGDGGGELLVVWIRLNVEL